MSEPRLDDNLGQLEAALKALAPVPARLQRDLVLFRAGQISARRLAWAWPGAAALLAVVAASLGMLLLVRPGPSASPRPIVVVLPQPDPGPKPGPPVTVDPPVTAAPGSQGLANNLTFGRLPDGYLRLREEMLRWGVDALPLPAVPSSPAATPRPMTAHDLFDWFPDNSSPRSRGPL
jgi:hypothetical protein